VFFPRWCVLEKVPFPFPLPFEVFIENILEKVHFCLQLHICGNDRFSTGFEKLPPVSNQQLPREDETI
jgi:hypothetical protein